MIIIIKIMKIIIIGDQTKIMNGVQMIIIKMHGIQIMIIIKIILIIRKIM